MSLCAYYRQYPPRPTGGDRDATAASPSSALIDEGAGDSCPALGQFPGTGHGLWAPWRVSTRKTPSFVR